MEERVRELEERLAAMERRLGWWRGGGLAVLILIVAVGVWSCARSGAASTGSDMNADRVFSELKTRQLAIVGMDGEELAFIGADLSDRVRFVVHGSKKATKAIQLGIDADGSTYFSMGEGYGPDDAPIRFLVAKDGRPRFDFDIGRGDLKASLSAPHGKGFVFSTVADALNSAHLGIGALNTPFLEMRAHKEGGSVVGAKLITSSLGLTELELNTMGERAQLRVDRAIGPHLRFLGRHPLTIPETESE